MNSTHVRVANENYKKLTLCFAATAADYTYEPEIVMYAHIEYSWSEFNDIGSCGSPPQTRGDSYSADVPLYRVKDGSGMYTSSQPYSIEHVKGGYYKFAYYERDECAKKTCEANTRSPRKNYWKNTARSR